MELSRLVVESLLTDGMREKMRIHFDHHDDFLDYSGGVFFIMALYIYKTSVSLDINGAQEKMEALALDDFRGGGSYGIHGDGADVRGGDEEWIRGSNPYGIEADYEVHHYQEWIYHKAFTKWDEVNMMEDGYKLADTASLTNYAEYAHLDPIIIVAWTQKEH
jgi:hypothetical protein